jgi:spore germination protein
MNLLLLVVILRTRTATLSSGRFGVTIQEIVNANQLTDPSKFYIGQVLNIPIVYHNIQPGETLWVIANRYGTAIVQANQIQNLEMI